MNEHYSTLLASFEAHISPTKRMLQKGVDMAPFRWPILLLVPALVVCVIYANPLSSVRKLRKSAQDEAGKVLQARSQARRRPLFSLIIGINTYRADQIDDLTGAVADATAFCTFLSATPDLPISASHATLLTNEQATRASILSELRALESDDRIQPGDPVMIYYAGYGGSSSTNANKQGNTRFILPYDCDDTVAPIWEQTIAESVHKLARAKGNNITIILDCGWTKPSKRLLPNSALVPHPRYTDVPPSFIQQDITAEHRADVDREAHDRLAPGLFSETTTHVLLAACGAEEFALEVGGRGVFTQALSETFEAVAREQITYDELVKRMPVLSGQTPQCCGLHLRRPMFTNPADSLTYPLKHPHSLIIRGSTGDFEVDATALMSHAGGSKLVMEGERSVRILIELGSGLEGVFDGLKARFASDGIDISSITRSDLHRFNASLRISLVEGAAVFDDLTTHLLEDPASINRLGGFRRLPYTTQGDLQSIYPVIRAATIWYDLLLRHPLDRSLSGGGRVTVEFTELGVVYDELGNPSYLIPSGSNLCHAVPVLGNVVDLVVHESKLYGQTVKNCSRMDLYPYMFCFDNSDFSIKPYHFPPVNTTEVRPEALPHSNSLPIGYGSEAAVPFSYYLREGQDVDLGYLKLFLTKEYVDMSHIAQGSPFESVGETETRGKTKEVAVYEWDELTVMLIQRRFVLE